MTTKCPTCGATCEVGGDETRYYIPQDAEQYKQDLLEWLNKRAERWDQKLRELDDNWDEYNETAYEAHLSEVALLITHVEKT